MEHDIGSRVPMLGLTGLGDFCPTIVADGDGGDCVDGAMIMPRHPELPRHLTTDWYSKDDGRLDSHHSSGYSSLASIHDQRMRDHVDEYPMGGSTNTTMICQAVQEDESYGSMTSLPSAEEIFSQDCDGDTLLHMAIIHENEILAMAFIRSAQKVSDLMIVNNLGQTPLHLAAYINTPNVVDMLIRASVHLDTRNRDGNTALHLACREGHLDVVRSLVSAQPQLSSVLNYDGLSCLHLAVKHHRLHAVQLLVQHKACDINVGDGCSGRTVLHYAVQAGDIQMTNFLVTYCHVDVNAPARDGLTPIMIATGQRNGTITTLLQQHGALYLEACADDGFCSDDDMDIESSILSVKHLDLNAIDHSDEEDLYS